MNIVELLQEQARLRPNAPAIFERRNGQERVLTFALLEAASHRAASLLHGVGLRPGDGVLLFVPMSADLYIALSAVFRLGLVAMFVDPSSGWEQIERSCRVSPPKALIATSKAHLLRFLSPSLRRIPHKFVLGSPVPGARRWEDFERTAPRADVHPATEDTGALLTFTSGSTGEPKAALRTHGFLLAQHRALQEALGLNAGEIDLATLPLFVLANLASGITSLIPDVDLRRPGTIDPARVVADIRAQRPTRAGASPAFFDRLAEYCEKHELTLPELRRVFTGGGPVFPSLLDRLQRIAPNAEVVAVYGSTEAEPISRITRSEISQTDIAAMQAGAGVLAGAPVPDIRLRILPDRWGMPIGPFKAADFAARCLPSGASGEIVVSGEHVLAGYVNAGSDEQTKFRVAGDAWHRTGDAGYLDDQGRLWLLGRCSARISDDRGVHYPFAVECAASYLPGVRRSALMGHNGRRILIVEASGPALNRDALMDTLNWAGVDEVQLWKRLPVDRRHNAKIDYPALLRKVGPR